MNFLTPLRPGDCSAYLSSLISIEMTVSLKHPKLEEPGWGRIINNECCHGILTRRPLHYDPYNRSLASECRPLNRISSRNPDKMPPITIIYCSWTRGTWRIPFSKDTYTGIATVLHRPYKRYIARSSLTSCFSLYLIRLDIKSVCERHSVRNRFVSAVSYVS